MTSESFRQLDHRRTLLGRACEVRLLGETEGTLARFGLKRLITSTAPAFRETPKKSRTLTSCRPSASRD
jgi:hypothetical protein